MIIESYSQQHQFQSYWSILSSIFEQLAQQIERIIIPYKSRQQLILEMYETEGIHFKPRLVHDGFIQSDLSKKIFHNQYDFLWEPKLLSKQQQPQLNDTLYLVDKICNKKQVQSFLDELICPICYEIVADPWSCLRCEKSFCALCIRNWKKQSLNTCPCCRKYFYRVSPGKFFQKLLNKFIFSCINEERGCNQQSFYSELKDHQKYCDYQIKNCPNKECSEEFLYKHEKQHLIECPYGKVECKGCQCYFKRKYLDIHQESCIYLMPYCQFCNKYIPLDFYVYNFNNCKKEYKKKQLIIQKLERPEKFDKYKKKQKSIKQFNTQPIYNKKNKYNYR